ncbi:hypothetical protein TSOC_007777 [Tetrabaena socialis]|uniref:Uncharacterized protein n=1 Tax=Tetrabaena socialis TaxID=47790 RepID=A0A2J8A081_9CHLO|nr:hypothetical protein TSOC_007777 [Tetrabaena socialis]|eukprot:PNH05933.1 hypothetical protein TSOC_007777 [Tetrabaena socialis]
MEDTKTPADCKLFALVREAGHAGGLKEDAFAGLGHVPIIQHLAAVLSVQENYVDPQQAELAELQGRYEDGPLLADEEVEELLALLYSNPDGFAAQTAHDPELRSIIEQIARDDELIRQNDLHLAGTKAQLAEMHESSQATRLQQQQAEQVVARQSRGVEQLAAAASALNAADSRAAQDVQECARTMQDLLLSSPERWLLSAQSLDELRNVEESTASEILRAKQQLCADQLSVRLAEQEAKQGAVSASPFGPSCTRILTGLTNEQYAQVMSEAERIAASRRLMFSQEARLRAELAGTMQQVQCLQQIADEAESGGGGGGSAPTGASRQHQLDPATEAHLRAEVEELQWQLDSLHEGEQRRDALDRSAALTVAPIKRAFWLLRHQQLCYVTQLQRQLLELMMQQWARSELASADERLELQDLFISLRSVLGDMQAERSAAEADAAEFRAVVAAAEAEAALATDRGPRALLGGEPALCASYALLDNQRQMLQAHARDVAAAAAAAAAEEADGRPAAPPPAGGGGGGFGAAGGGVGFFGGGVKGFLDSVLADPAHRSVSQLAAAVEAVEGLMAGVERAVAGRVRGQLAEQVAAGRAGVEAVQGMLAAGPAAEAPSLPPQHQPQHPQQQQQQPGVVPGGAEWPVYRDPALQVELAGTSGDVARVVRGITALVSRQNLLLDGQKRQHEQARLERSVLGAFWNAPEQLLRDVQGLRDRLSALLSAQ